MKKLLALLLVALMVVSMVGCSGTPAATTAPAATKAPAAATKAPAAATPAPTTGNLEITIVATPAPTAEASELDKFAKDNFNTTGWPIVNEPITVEIMAAYNNYQTTDFADVMWVQEMEKKTGIHVEWNLVTTSARNEQKNIMMASGDLPDALMKMNFTQNDLFKYGYQQEMLADLRQYAPLAPNYFAFLDANSTVDAALSFGEEKAVYGFPYIVNVTASLCMRLHMNMTALEAVGLDQPKTTEELYEALQKMVAYDINGNGEKDEIGIGANSIGNIENYFMGAFGLRNRGNVYAHLDVNPADGTLRHIYTSEQYKALLEYLNRLYAEGLIDPDIFTDGQNSATAAGYAGQLSAFIAQNALHLNNEWKEHFDGLDAMITGPYGDQFLSQGGRISLPGALVISVDSEYIEELIRWVDYNYCLDGIIEFFMGYEGVSFNYNADGTATYVDSITSADSLDTAYSQYVLWAGGQNPSMSTPGYFSGAAVQPLPNSSMTKLQPFMVDVVWESVMVDEKHQSKLAAVSTDMETCLAEWRANFITGAASLDQWDEYVKAMEACGLKEYLEIYDETFRNYGMLD